MSTQTLEPRLIADLQRSAREIFETMVFMSPQSIDAIAEDTPSFNTEVMGLLPFTGTCAGTFIVRTTEDLARTIAAKMLMMGASEVTSFEAAADAFGEVVNMLSGSFKNAWVATGNQMDLSVPNVILNGNVTLKSNGSDPLRSGIRICLDLGTVDVGVHFETTN